MVGYPPSALSDAVATGHTWLLSTGNVAGATNFHFASLQDANSHVCPAMCPATVMALVAPPPQAKPPQAEPTGSWRQEEAKVPASVSVQWERGPGPRLMPGTGLP